VLRAQEGTNFHAFDLLKDFEKLSGFQKVSAENYRCLILKLPTPELKPFLKINLAWLFVH
jgi:hypothetical protein